MRAHQRVVDHRSQSVVVELLNLVDLVRDAVAIEEVDEWDAGPLRRCVRDQRQILRFLHRARSQECEARRAHGHHVGVVAED